MSTQDDFLVISNLVSSETAIPALLSEEPAVATCDRKVTKDFDKQKTYQTGQTINIRIEDEPALPVKSPVFANDPIVQQEIPVTVYQWNTGFILSDVMNMLYTGGKEQVKKTIVMPRVTSMATQANIEIYNSMAMFPLVFGTPGQVPTNFLAWANGAAILDNQLTPKRKRYGVMNPTTMMQLADNVKNMGESKESAVAFLEGDVKEAAGQNFYSTTNFPNHTNGSQAANGLSGFKVAVNPASGAITLSVSGGTTSNTITQGSVISFPGLKQIQPQSKKVLADDMTFVVTADLTLSSGSGVLSVYPPIVGPENPKLQSISALPTTANYIKLFGTETATYEQGVIYYGPNMKFASLKMEDLIMNLNTSYEEEDIYVRCASVGDNTNSQNQCRLDILFGINYGRWQQGVRYFGRAIG